MDTRKLSKLLCFALAAIIPLLSGCASSPAVARNNEAALIAAGFRARTATSVRQQQALRTLPSGMVSSVNHNGRQFYIYPEASNNRLYVGNEEAYRRLKASGFTPTPDSAGPVGYNIPTAEGDIPVSVIRDWRPFNDIL